MTLGLVQEQEMIIDSGMAKEIGTGSGIIMVRIRTVQDLDRAVTEARIEIIITFTTVIIHQTQT